MKPEYIEMFFEILTAPNSKLLPNNINLVVYGKLSPSGICCYIYSLKRISKFTDTMFILPPGSESYLEQWANSIPPVVEEFLGMTDLECTLFDIHSSNDLLFKALKKLPGWCDYL